MLNVLDVSRSGYYAWLTRPKSNRTLENETLETSIEEVYKASRGNSGSRKVQHGLEAQGIKASRSRIARIMSDHARQVHLMVKKSSRLAREVQTQISCDNQQQAFAWILRESFRSRLWSRETKHEVGF